VDDAFGDAFAVERRQLLEEVVILRAAGPRGPMVRIDWLLCTGCP
jgi:hypothetical protein